MRQKMKIMAALIAGLLLLGGCSAESANPEVPSSLTEQSGPQPSVPQTVQIESKQDVDFDLEAALAEIDLADYPDSTPEAFEKFKEYLMQAGPEEAKLIFTYRPVSIQIRSSPSVTVYLPFRIL